MAAACKLLIRNVPQLMALVRAFNDLEKEPDGHVTAVLFSDGSISLRTQTDMPVLSDNLELELAKDCEPDMGSSLFPRRAGPKLL